MKHQAIYFGTWLALATCGAWAEVQFTTFAYTGQQAIGVGDAYQTLGVPSINDLGQIAARAKFASHGTTVAWFKGINQPTIVVKEGDRLPGMPAGFGPNWNGIVLHEEVVGMLNGRILKHQGAIRS